MGRVGIYLKDKIEREVRDIVQQDLQNGANAGEANISATCNELIRLGLVYKRDGEDGNQFRYRRIPKRPHKKSKAHVKAQFSLPHYLLRCI
jgi:hypothetical protein